MELPGVPGVLALGFETSAVAVELREPGFLSAVGLQGGMPEAMASVFVVDSEQVLPFELQGRSVVGLVLGFEAPAVAVELQEPGVLPAVGLAVWWWLDSELQLEVGYCLWVSGGFAP